jgi:hypothetical protein
MSPEQAEGKPDVDGRADVWSLGAVLYECIAGAPPFADRGSYHGTIVGILTSRPKLLHDAAPWVPADLARVVDAMLVHDRAARIKDAETVTQRLLEAFPAVLPDGTGRHTAVIVARENAAVDTVGDTETFESAALPAALRQRREDSSRTVPDVTTGPGLTEATRTAAATPVDLGRETPSAPKTEPLLDSDPELREIRGVPPKDRWGGPGSSAQGVAMPGTPPHMAPITPVPSQLVPDTMRDVKLAKKAQLRYRLTVAAIAIGILVVGAVAFMAGQRSQVNGPPPASATTPPKAPEKPVVTATQPTAADTTVPTMPASALPSASAARPTKP